MLWCVLGAEHRYPYYLPKDGLFFPSLTPEAPTLAFLSSYLTLCGFPQTACFYGCVTLQILRHFYIFLWTASNSLLLSPLQGKYWHPPVETWRLRPTETEQLGSACCGGKTTGSGIGSAQVQVPASQRSSGVVRHHAPISEPLFSP